MKPTSPYDLTLTLLPMWLTEMPPAGLSALSTYLRHAGYRLRVLNLNIECFHRVSEKKRRIWERENFMIWSDPGRFKEIAEILAPEIEHCVNRLLEHPAPILAFSTIHPNRNFTKTVLSRIRELDPTRLLVVGGRGWEREPDRRIFKYGTPDALVEGEGEEALVEIIECVRRQGDLFDVPGVLGWDGSTYRWGGIRPLITNLDALPLPTYEEFDLAAYTKTQLPLTLSRGCISHCAYCNDQKMAGRFRNRSGARVAEEAAWCNGNLGTDYFQFTDSAVNGNLRELLNFARIISRAGLNIGWEGSAIPRRGMTAEHLTLLAQSGCRSLTFGIESGSDRVLGLMKRRYSAQEQARVLRETHQAGIETRINLIVGYPGETESDFQETADWLRQNRQWISGISNLNSCQVLYPSDLRLSPDAFGVVLPEDLHVTEEGWRDTEGLNHQIRSERLSRLSSLVEELGLAFWTSNERRKELSPAEISELK